MGLWDSIKSGFKKVVDAVKSFFTGTSSVNRKAQEDVGSSDIYGTSEDYKVKEYARQTTEYIRQYGPLADQMEEACIDEYREYFLNLLNQAAPKDQELLMAEFEKNVGSIKGTIKKYVNNKHITDNPEFLRILQMDAGKNKNKAYQEFQEKTEGEAVDLLCVDIEKSLKVQYKFIEKYFNDQSATIKAVNENMNREYATLEQELRNPEKTDAKKRIQQYAANALSSEYMLDLLNQ